MFHGVNLVPECATHSRPSSAPGTPCIPDPNADAPGWYVTETDPDPSRRFTDADAQTLRSLGIDFVRLGIHWEALEPGTGVGANDPRYCRRLVPGQAHDEALGDAVWNPAVADEYLRHVDAEVALFARHGIKVLLDMHSGAVSQYFAKPNDPNTPWMGSGAPLWAVCTDASDPPGVYPAAYPSGWNSAYFTVPLADAADHFWNNDVAANLQSEYIRSWTYVVDHYVRSPLISDIVGYELANEPVDINELASPTFDAKLQCDYVGSAQAPQSCAAAGTTAYAQQVGLIPAIQAVDPKRLIFYEPPILADEGFPPQQIGQHEPMPFDNLVLSFHTYNPASEASPFQMEAGARAATKTGHAGDQTPAWFNTEFGASDSTSDIGAVIAQADQNLVSWTYWAALQLHDPTGAPTERLIDDNTRQLIFPKACLMAGAHVTAYAGTPT